MDIIKEDKLNIEKQGLKPKFVFHQQNDVLKAHTESSLARTWETTIREMDIINGAKVYRNQIKESTFENVDNLKIYCLRHTYCSLLNDCEIGSYYKKRLMGHTLKDSITDGVYTHTTEEKIIKAAKPFIKLIENIHSKI